MAPATANHRAFTRIESPLPCMRYFAVFRMGETIPFARIGTRAFDTAAEGVAKLATWYPGCLIYTYNPEA